MKRLILLTCFVLISASCSTTPTDSLGEFTPTLYLEGYLIAGQPVDNVYVGTTTPLLETFTREEVGLPDATVVLSVDGTDWVLTSVGGGHYANPKMTIEVGKMYALRAETTLGTLTASTVVPVPPALTSTGSSVSADLSSLEVSWLGETEAG
jgi:hypothetical protein